MYCIVSPFSKTFDEKGLIYFVPDYLRSEIKEGMAINIPMKSQIEPAIVLKIIKENEITIEIKKIKSIISIVGNNNIILNSYQIYLIFWISKFYFCQIHHSTNLFLPKNIRDKIKKDKLGDFISKKTLEEINNLKPDNKILLSENQEIAYKNILNSKDNKILFYGITGSGKTEIYLKLIENYINEGKQALLLIPEIILNNQIGERIKSYFGEDVLIINSSITEATKAKYWARIYLGQTKLVVGTRSSLFYPFKDLGIIIIDEQHDNSYNSDKNPRFKTGEVVEQISDIKGIKLIFASGTPSINYMYRAIKKDLHLVNLLERYS